MEIKVNVTVNGEVDVQKIAEQIRQQIEKAQKPALNVGDYAKTLTESKHGGTKAGEVVLIESIQFPSETGHIVAVRNDKGQDGLYKPADLILASDEEVAEAKRKLAEKAEAKRWAAIGRKPGELRVGDIVERCPGFFDVVANPEGGLNLDSGEKLVTPVEARFDRA